MKLLFGFAKGEQQLKVPGFLAKNEPIKETEDELRARMVPPKSTFMTVNKRYVEEYISYRNRVPLTFATQFALANNGSAAAEEVDIIVTLPDFVSCSPAKPIEPKPVYSAASTMKVQALPKFVITENGSKIQFKLRDVKQGSKVTLDTVYITFKSAASAQSFEADYSVNAHAPNSTSGKLKFVFDKNLLASLHPSPVESEV